MDDATQVDVVLNALVDVLTAALPSVEVIDGQPLATNRPEVLVVGWSANRTAVEIVQEVSDAGDHRDEEMSVVCLASSARGDTDAMRVSRGNASAVLDEVKAALADDPSLGGLVERAELGFALSLDQAQGDGAAATIEFTIRVAVM